MSLSATQAFSKLCGCQKPRSFAQTSAGIGEGISPAARDSPSRCASRLRSITARVQLAALLQLNQHLPGDLFQGDLKYTVDFRRVYAGVLESWLKTDSSAILGRQFDPLELLQA